MRHRASACSGDCASASIKFHRRRRSRGCGQRLAALTGAGDRASLDQRGAEHQPIYKAQIAPRRRARRVIRRQHIEPFRLDAAGKHHVRVTPPPRGSASSRQPDRDRKTWRSPHPPGRPAATIDSSTNVTVAEDILPKSPQDVARDVASAVGASSKARSTASSTVRPPGCTAHKSIVSAFAPARMSPA